MQQEILTTEMIKRDYQKLFIKSIRSLLVIISALLLLSALIVSVFSQLDDSKLMGWLLASPLIFTLCICFAALSENFRDYKAIKNNVVRIVADRLENKRKRMPGGAGFGWQNRPYTLHFANYGDYYISRGIYYSSSRFHSMNEYGVFSHASINDQFHIVIDNRNRILAVYNMNLFTFYK